MKIDFTIGKYTLESLINGMYASPFDLYREYIQNAVDSFDMMISNNIVHTDLLQILIKINTKEKSISIKDNGLGISSEIAAKTLLDIGNSQKLRHNSRGFRGIGRLSGLGYCDKLTFITSAKDESIKTIVFFDAKKLKELLLINNETKMDIHSIVEEIVTIEYAHEKPNSHYFEVILENVNTADKLISEELVLDYLIQNCPLPFSKNFSWKSMILSKFEQLEHKIVDYNLILSVDGVEKELFKPYENVFVADRIKKATDTIKDIEVIPFYRNDRLAAILWYARINFYGTIMNNQIKGIRIRQGNILVGDKTTFNKFFKEERFNGWIIGELHIIDSDLIINSRRDDFEKNNAYYDFFSLIQEWTQVISKEIRKKSYERSLTRERYVVLESDYANGLNIESLETIDDLSENVLMNLDESSSLAEEDFFSTIFKFLHKQKMQTRYSALNVNCKLTIEQRRVLERVFDLITQEYSFEEAEKFITLISKKY